MYGLSRGSRVAGVSPVAIGNGRGAWGGGEWDAAVTDRASDRESVFFFRRPPEPFSLGRVAVRGVFVFVV